jgi:hypothetical protein
MGLAGLILLSAGIPARAQVDPIRRELIQLGYNQPLEGKGPLAVYAFYFLNKPNFLDHTNLTLRLAVAPVYMDSEVAVSQVFGPYTDVGFGLAGGGYADSYYSIAQGDYQQDQSFVGHGGEAAVSLYHLFNPESRVPLNSVLRGGVHYTAYTDDNHTADDFVLPNDQPSFRVRAGLRFGGREPVMLPQLAMELSVWYEGNFRTDPGRYGFSGDRDLEAASHLFWARILFTYTLPKLKHNFNVNITSGTGIDVDRLTAYRLGGNLPLYSEFPLSLPGYYFQELSARDFVLLGGSYILPLDHRQNWNVSVQAATAWMDYLPGLSQPGAWNSGVGGALVYRSPSDSWQFALGYGYGIDAIRKDGRGASSVSFLLQFDLDRTRRRFLDPGAALPGSRGLQQFMRTILR